MTPQTTSRTPADRKRALRLAGALIGLAVALGACKHNRERGGAGERPQTITACATRSRSRKPTARSSSSSAADAAVFPLPSAPT